MNLTKMYFTGFNGFQQFGKEYNDFTNRFSEFHIENLITLKDEDKIGTILIHCDLNYTALVANRTLYLTGGIICGDDDDDDDDDDDEFHCDKKKEPITDDLSKYKRFSFDEMICDISGNMKYCLVLLKNGQLYKISVDCDNGIPEEISIPLDNGNNEDGNIGNTTTVKRKKFSIDNLEIINEQNKKKIINIICGHTFSIAYCIFNNTLYNLPTKLHTFPKDIRLAKICCGAEHFMALTDNGDVYVWGSSTRGQLGLDSLETEETPVLIPELQGTKIVDIAAGAWHSAAVSSFGHLYMWGWNVNGQIGKPLFKSVYSSFEDDDTIEEQEKQKELELTGIKGKKQKLPTVFGTPQIIIIPYDVGETNQPSNVHEYNFIKNVWCGSRHTIVRTKFNNIYGTGWNKYGQLALDHETIMDENIDRFRQIPMPDHFELNNIICGNWCTLLIGKQKC